MDQNMEAQDFYELQALARKLRVSAAETMDLRYIELFLRTAAALDERASLLALTDGDIPGRERRSALHGSVSVRC